MITVWALSDDYEQGILGPPTEWSLKKVCGASVGNRQLIGSAAGGASAGSKAAGGETTCEHCLPHLLLEQVRIQPDNIAVVWDDACLTYRELAREATVVARCLRSLGVRPDDLTGVFAGPSLDLMTGVWGVLLAGGGYVPLSPDYPPERLRYVLANCEPKVILTQRERKPSLTGLAPRGTAILTPGDLAELARTMPAGTDFAPAEDLLPSHLAYLIYTSGSTGRPKGVMIEHASIVSQMNWLHDVHSINARTTLLHKTPISFDAAQWELLALACGSRVVVGGAGIYRDPHRLISTITRYGVDALQCVPTLLQALLDTERLSECTSLVQIFSGGEVLSRRLARDCLAELPECRLINLYGPTECTINASSFIVGRPMPDDALAADPSGAIPIGKPASNTQFHILDAASSPVKGNEIGELYIGGVQLARGYLGDPVMTAQKFVHNPLWSAERPGNDRPGKLYRTGDLARWNPDGTVQFAGRMDSQVKLRGYRIELDEIRLAIETHDWVRKAAAVVRNDANALQRLVAFIELNPREAALMDQGSHGAHHLSKLSRLQAKAQLSNAGCLADSALSGRPVVELPWATPGLVHRRQVFARKSYRFFDGGEVAAADITGIIAASPPERAPRGLDQVRLADLGEILRYFGQYRSEERLLPKYGYASPGALYATQLYLEISWIAGLPSGLYYYHPVRHQLILIQEKIPSDEASAAIHFIGKKSAIQPVYINNIQEVLEIEAGHMVGLLDHVLPARGLDISELAYDPEVKRQLPVAPEDYYLGTFEIVSHIGGPSGRALLMGRVAIYVQAHSGRITGLPDGQYEYRDGRLRRLSAELVLKKHVVAINQQVYARSSFGISVIADPARGWLGYVDLGRVLHHLQSNDRNLGLMSSGYSSRTGHDLASATRINEILRACGRESGPSYFSLGGRVSDEQVRSEGMREDAVHMKGPTELIRDDLVTLLPDYMVPSLVVVLDELPLTPNGKIDYQALATADLAGSELADRPPVPPRTDAEAEIARIWSKELAQPEPSVLDDFFAAGGDSLIAVRLITSINARLGSCLPLQVLFECPTIEQIAARIDAGHANASSRLVRLAANGTRLPAFCWPGLGGFAMNLKLLAESLDIGQPVYGVQTYGINDGEEPYQTISQMAAADVALIRQVQPAGRYTLWGYSFGARVAFEAAYQLEASGEVVENLVLIAPGMPKVPGREAGRADGAVRSGRFRDLGYLTILFSVFSGSITDPLLDECLSVVTDEESFCSFIAARLTGFDHGQVRRIVRVVAETYGLIIQADELKAKVIKAPITVLRADGDENSFIDAYQGGHTEFTDVGADHYSMLRSPAVGELIAAIHRKFRLPSGKGNRPGNETARVSRETAMPHVNIKHFPVSLSEEEQSELVRAITAAVGDAFGCDEKVISIALEPVAKDDWTEQVYVPEIEQRRDLLAKVPNY